VVNADGGGVSNIDLPDHDACDCADCMKARAAFDCKEPT
jgi:hypothetical protein